MDKLHDSASLHTLGLTVRKRLFTLTLQHFKVEEFLSMAAVKILFSLQFALIGLSFVEYSGIFQIKSTTRAELSQTWWGAFLGFHLLLYFVFVKALLKEYRVEEKPDWTVYVSVWLKLVHLYVFTPLFVWFFGYSSMYYIDQERGDQTSPLMALFSTVVLLSSLCLSMVFLQLMRNNFPTEGKISSPSLTVETSVYFILIAIQYFHQLSPSYSVLVLRIIDVAGCIVFLITCCTTIFFGVFWCLKTNSFYLRCLARLTVLRIYTVVLKFLVPESSTSALGIPFFLIIQDLAARTAATLSHKSLMTRVSFAIDKPFSFGLYFAVFTFQILREKVLRQGINPDLLTPEEKDLRLVKAKYRIAGISLQQNHSDRQGATHDSPHGANSDGNTQHGPTSTNTATASTVKPKDTHELIVFTYLNFLIKNQAAEVDHLLIILRIMIMTICHYMTVIPSIMHRLKKKIGPKYNQYFDFFHIESLIRGRMMLVYARTEAQKQVVRKPLSEIYRDLSYGQNAEITLDINRVFSQKDKYAELCLTTQRYIDKKTDLLLYVHERSVLESSFLYTANKKLHILGHGLDQSFKELAEQPYPAPYLLAATTTYFLKVRYKIKEAEMFFKRYRNQLKRMQNSANNLEKITDFNMLLNSVVVKVDLNRECLGRIVDITPGYREYIGQPSGKDPVGTDVNDLFPPAFRKEHREMMVEFKNIHIFNDQLKFYINTYEGYLRPIDFYIKLGADIKDDFNSMVLLRFKNPSDRHLVLLDDKFNIMAAEKEFWQVLEGLGFTEQPKNLREIADSVCCNLNMYKFMNRELTPEEINTETGYLRWKECLTKAYSHLKDLGVIHKLNVDLGRDGGSPLNIPMIVNFEFERLGNVHFTKVWVKFDLMRQKESRLIKRTLDYSKYTLRNKVDGLDTHDFSSPVRPSQDSTPPSDNYKDIVYDDGSSKSSKNLKDDETKENVPFEQILVNLKKVPQIGNFIADGTQRNLNPEVSGSILWAASYMESAFTGNREYAKRRETPRGFTEYIVKEKDLLAKGTLPASILRYFSREGDSKFALSEIVNQQRDHNSSPVAKVTPTHFSQAINTATNQPSNGQDSSKWRKVQQIKVGQLKGNNGGMRTVKTPPASLKAKVSPVLNVQQQRESTKTDKNLDAKEFSPVHTLLQKKAQSYRKKNITLHRLQTVDTRQADQLKREHCRQNENEVFFSSAHRHVDELLKHIVSRQVMRRELSKNLEGESLSSHNTTSRIATLFKSFSAVVESRKRVTPIFVWLTGVLLSTIYFVISFEMVSIQLTDFNKANLVSFQVTQSFIRMDRELVEATEQLSTYYQYTLAYSNDTAMALVQDAYVPLFKSYPPAQFMERRLNASIQDLKDSVDSISHMATYSVDQNNAIDIKDVLFQSKRYRYDREMGKREAQLIDTHMSYYTFIHYYIDSFNRGRDQLHALSQLYGTGATDPASATHQEDLLASLKVTLFDQLRNFYADTFPSMRTTFEHLSDTLVLKDVERHFDSIWTNIYVSIGIFIGYLFYLIYVYQQISKRIQSLLANYSFLKVWELHSMVDELTEERETFSRFWFNELHLINRYLEFSSSEHTNECLDRVHRLQDHYKRDKAQARLKHDFFLKSTRQLIYNGILTFLIFVISVSTVFAFSEVNKKRMGLQELNFQTHALLTDVTGNYLSTFLLQARGQSLLMGGRSPVEELYPNATQTLIEHITSHKSQLDGYLGGNVALEMNDLFFGDICMYIPLTSSLQKYDFDLEGVCRQGMLASTQKGLLGFIQAQTYYLETLKARLLSDEQGFLVASSTEDQPPLIGYLFEPTNVEQRVTNWIVYQIFYEVWLTLSDQRVSQIQQDMELYVSGIIFYSVLVMSVAVALAFLFAVREVRRDLVVGYEVFTILDPFYMVNNKLLYNQLHASYTGIS